MGFSRKSNDSGPQEWRWTSHQTSYLGLRLLLRWQEGAQRNHGAPTLPALASSRPSAALCWVSPDASQRGPQIWIRTWWRGFQEDESVNTIELQGTPLSYCKSSKNHLISKIIPSPQFFPVIHVLSSCMFRRMICKLNLLLFPHAQSQVVMLRYSQSVPS